MTVVTNTSNYRSHHSSTVNRAALRCASTEEVDGVRKIAEDAADGVLAEVNTDRSK